MQTFTPLVLRSLASSWPAVGKWDLDFFSTEHGNVEVEVTLAEGKRRKQALGDCLSDAPI